MDVFQQNILDWFAAHSRALPWRQTYHPYHVWISEIMLQQTQMDRAVFYFNRWLQRFPDIESLARASEEEVHKLWEGLGYYARARNVLKTARLLMRDHGGVVPDNHDVLLKLPGIGAYTAGAIMSLAFNRDCPIVDANIERIFARCFDIDQPVKAADSRAFIWQKAGELVPPGRAREFNQALMELGALVCLPRTPDCDACPIKTHCEAQRLGIIEHRPIAGRKTEFIPIEMVTGILIDKGRIFIQKREAGDVWANLWEFPGGRLKQEETPEHALVREYMEETEFHVQGLEKIRVVKHSYTRYRVTLHCYFCVLANGRTDPVLHAAQEFRWVKPRELDRFAFPAGHRKLIDGIMGELVRRAGQA